MARDSQQHRLRVAGVRVQLVAHLPADLLSAELHRSRPALLPAREPQVPPESRAGGKSNDRLQTHLRHQHREGQRLVSGMYVELNVSFDEIIILHVIKL